MRLVVLLRCPSTDEGTLGRVFIDGDFFCHSLELPGRGNEPNYSRVPAGEYLCTWHKSPSFGWVYKLQAVPQRSHILIHPANWAGDSRIGFRCQLAGCIALGERRGRLQGQLAVLASRSAVDRFAAQLARRPFKLLIKDFEHD